MVEKLQISIKTTGHHDIDEESFVRVCVEAGGGCCVNQQPGGTRRSYGRDCQCSDPLPPPGIALPARPVCSMKQAVSGAAILTCSSGLSVHGGPRQEEQNAGWALIAGLGYLMLVGLIV